MSLPVRSVGPLRVSALGLGCMGMSYAYGSRRRHRGARHAAPRARPRRHLPRHRRHLRRRPQRGAARRGRSPTGATRWCWRPSSASCPATTDDQRRRRRQPGVRPVGLRGVAAPARGRRDRPVLPAPPRPGVPIEDTVGAMAELVAGRQGAAPRPLRGVGDDPAASRSGASDRGRADRSGRCSAATSRPRSCPTCRELGIGLVPYSPLGPGPAHRRADRHGPARRRRLPPHAAPVRRRRARRATSRWWRRSGRSPQRVARRPARWHWPGCWPRARTSSRSPAPSGSRYLEENVGALGVTLSADDMTRLDDLLPEGDRYPDMTWVERNTPTPAR